MLKNVGVISGMFALNALEMAVFVAEARRFGLRDLNDELYLDLEYPTLLNSTYLPVPGQLEHLTP